MAHDPLPAYRWLAVLRARRLDISADYYMACDLACPADVLDLLLASRDKNVLAKIASHPNASADTLRRVALWEPYTADGVNVATELCRRPDCPGDILAQLIRLSVRGEQRAGIDDITAHPNCPEDVLRAKIGITRWQHGIASNPSCPTDLLEALSYNLDLLVVVASNPNCPTELLTRWTTYPDKRIRAALASNPSIDPEWLDTCDSLEFDCELAALSNPVCSTRLLERALELSGTVYCKAVARNPNLPIHMIWTLALMQDPDVLSTLCCNPAIPADVLNHLVVKTSSDTDRWQLTQHPNADANTLRLLAGWGGTTLMGAVAHPNVPADVILNAPLAGVVMPSINSSRLDELDYDSTQHAAGIAKNWSGTISELVDAAQLLLVAS